MKVVSLYVDKSLVKGFRLYIDEPIEKFNKRSLLLYHLSELMNNPEAFFTFKEDYIDGMIELEKAISAEELVLQLQLVHQELRRLMEKVITPLALVKALKNFPGSELYEGESIYSIVISSSNNLVEEIRRIIDLFSQGYLDIDKFQSPDLYRENLEVEYLFKNVETEKVNLAMLLESFQPSKFTGLVNIAGGEFGFEIYYKGGKVSAIHPHDPNIFEILVNTKRCILSVIKTPEALLDLIVLKHAKDKVVRGLSVEFLEIGKIFMTMHTEGKSGAIILRSSDCRDYVLYKDGILLCILKERGDDIKVLRKLSLEKPAWVDIAFHQPMDNIREVAHLFLINILYRLLLKHAGYINPMVLSRLSSSEVFKHQEGTILYRRSPKDHREVSDFLDFLLDLNYKLLGKEKLEKELEMALSPYKEVLKILQVEEYIKH
ncbi:MAG: hypothetical protein ACK4OF_01800 [Aquificaceae bacterium]